MTDPLSPRPGGERPREPTRGHPARSPRGGSSPVILIRLESRLSRAIVLVALLAGAAGVARVIVSPAVADHLGGGAVAVAELERASAWDPGNPRLHLRLADAYRTGLDPADLDRARAHLETALHRRPTDALAWLRFAALADRQGDREQARSRVEVALGYDPNNVLLRWEAALLALTWGERDRALEHLRYVLRVDPARREAAFQLGRALLGPRESVAGLLPAEPEPLTGLLRTAVRNQDLALAQAVWERRAVVAPAISEDLQRRYLDLLLDAGQGPAARRLWLAMNVDGRSAVPGEAVSDGGFEADRLLGWGLGWRVRRVWGVDVSLDAFVAARGRRSLRLGFNSFPTLDFAGVYQVAPVEPGGTYQLHALAKAVGFVTRSGLKLQVVTPDGEQLLAETGTVAGTTADWVRLEGHLRVPPEVSLVHVRLRREPAPEPEGNLGGNVWVDEISLAPAPGTPGERRGS